MEKKQKYLIVDAGSRTDTIKAMLRHFDEWCHCGCVGYWYEQIDGPTNRTIVKCERHWKPEMLNEAERNR